MDVLLGVENMETPINLREFMDMALKNMKVDNVWFDEIDIAKCMNVDENEIVKLTKSIDIEKLAHPSDSRITEFIPGITEVNRVRILNSSKGAEKLASYRKIINAKEIKNGNHRKTPFQRSIDIYKKAMIPVPIESNNNLDMYNDLLISVRIYRSARATHISQTIEQPVFAQEFVCLGSNYLTELRDKISCICKTKKFFDISESPLAELPDKTTDPNFLYIQGTFYNDTRNPNNLLYSDDIFDWAKTAYGLDKVKFKIAKMEETKFFDLTVSLGFPQLYMHHGNCEHAFTISNIKVLTPDERNLPRNYYPYLNSFNIFNQRNCDMCNLLRYDFIVEYSVRAIRDPEFVCRSCLLQYHYDENMKKIGDFMAYRMFEYKDENVEIENKDGEEKETKTKMVKKTNLYNANVEGKAKEAEDEDEDDDEKEVEVGVEEDDKEEVEEVEVVEEEVEEETEEELEDIAVVEVEVEEVQVVEAEEEEEYVEVEVVEDD